jgi:hypothetical protein
MSLTKRVVYVGLIFFSLSIADAQNPAATPKQYPLWAFDEAVKSCRSKGRLQDREYCSSRLMDFIVAQGKAAIPVLISQLTETRETSKPIFDYWSMTNSGDIAFFILNDLFMDSDWKTFNMPGLESLNYPCDDAAETCWRRFLDLHGRKFVQEQWLNAWNKNEDRIYWHEEARCFRLLPAADGKNKAA